MPSTEEEGGKEEEGNGRRGKLVPLDLFFHCLDLFPCT
jgi:hypothetical protein